MSSSFILFFSLISLLPSTLSQLPQSFYINCGASSPVNFNGHQWISDDAFISAGESKRVTGVLPILSYVRSFGSEGNIHKKFCYLIGPVIRSAKYMVRTTYFYGGVNGPSRETPPVFDQIVDGTLWGLVNTTEDYARNMSTYYEGVFKPVGRELSLCIGVNELTDSDPFISAIEVVMLEDSVYNTTDFGSFGLSLISRNNFGYVGPMLRSPDDRFDRVWQPFGPHQAATQVPNVSVSGFWNLPPAKIFETRLTVNSGPMELLWPDGPLPPSTYYIALYFADDRVTTSWRAFDISINDVQYIRNLTVSQDGVAVFATKWPLAGSTRIIFTPVAGSNAIPLINGGEIFNVLPLGRRTHVRDVIVLQRIKRSFLNPPEDWSGDPCFPAGYSWTGITCSNGTNGTRVRILSINLMNMGLLGSLSPHVANLTALNRILLGNNSLSGVIPSSLSNLKHLEILGLENNRFNGTIPLSLGDIRSLQELHLENNDLIGTVPRNLLQKPGLRFSFTPGNRLSVPAGQNR